MAAPVLYAVGSAVLPLVVNGVASWVGKATDTWGPAAIANQTIKAAENAGASRFGTIGKIAGRIIGYGMGPVVAQNPTIRNNVSLGGQIAGQLAGAAVGVVAQVAINSIFGPKKAEEPKAPAAPIANQDPVAAQIQLEMLKELRRLREAEEKRAQPAPATV